MTKPSAISSASLTARTIEAMADVSAAAWNACANPTVAPFNPFVDHAFLKALEDAGTVGGTSGWVPRHVLIEDSAGTLLAAAPCYLKGHSQGEYIFDHAWADAYMRAGGRYYPKLLVAIPFTPVPGPRLLVPPGPDHDTHELALASALVSMAKRHGISGVHINFLGSEPASRLVAAGFLERAGQQFHWHNRGYKSFDGFLAGFASRKRKAVRKEREQALANAITIELVTGADITEQHWDAMYAFYIDTGSRKWGEPYLNRAFFASLGATMAQHCLLVLARRQGRHIAGALNMIGGDCLYGRYWGAIEHHPCLHFEVCYYQAIDYAITHGLARVEPGAGGEHKLARGYLPSPASSVHWIGDAGFRKAIAAYLVQERAAVRNAEAAYTEAGPFRKDPPRDPRNEDHD